MPREGAIIFRDLVGKLEVLNVECDKCGRRGRYRLYCLIQRYGVDAKLFDRSDQITANCRVNTKDEQSRERNGGLAEAIEA
jgi:hypothetical protein